MGFLKSMSQGKNGENAAISLFQLIGIDCKKDEDKDKRNDHDLVCQLDKLKFTVEVKHDLMAEKTGNIAVEYHNSKLDKPSGIYSTKANLLVYIVPDQDNMTIWVCSVKKVREFIKDVAPFRSVKNAGDKNANLFLYKEDDILGPLFIRIDNISKDEALKVIKKHLKDK